MVETSTMGTCAKKSLSKSATRQQGSVWGGGRLGQRWEQRTDQWLLAAKCHPKEDRVPRGCAAGGHFPTLQVKALHCADSATGLHVRFALS